MLFWEIRDEEGKCFGTETDFGNAAELHMILCEMNPEKKLSMVEVDEVEGKKHRDGSVSKYIEDPSGNKIELIKYE